MWSYYAPSTYTNTATTTTTAAATATATATAAFDMENNDSFEKTNTLKTYNKRRRLN